MQISLIYDRYQIMPNLQEHMFRVTGVAAMMCDAISPPIERDHILTACLLHDLGNITKFDLQYFPDFLEPQGLEYWQKVQEEYISKYGKNSHLATIQMIKELGVSDRVIELIDAISFNLAEENLQSDDFSRKICAYADMRVAPQGVVSLAERLADLEVRYDQRYPSEQDKQLRQKADAALRQMEVQIFAHCSISPSDITDAAINDKIRTLREYDVPVTS